jgi:hypothetical protein
MGMMKKLLTASAVAAAMTAGVAQAATLSIIGGTSVTVDNDFSLAAQTGLVIGQPGLKEFDSTNIAGAGLFLSGPSKLRFTFVGKEAGATNMAFRGPASGPANTPGNDPSGSNTTLLFNNQSSAINSFVEILSPAGFVNFLFQTTGLSGAPNNETLGDGISSGNNVDGFAIIRNGFGADDTRISMTLFQINGSRVLALFGDGRGDSDQDDMAVEISAVPVPAAGFLLIGALGGLVALRRRKTA